MAVKTTTTKSELQAPAIFKVTNKQNGETCYMVPSNSEEGTYHKVCYDAKAVRWNCTCKSGQHGCTNCVHIRAAQISVIANKPAKTPIGIGDKGVLNGGPKAFSLL